MLTYLVIAMTVEISFNDLPQVITPGHVRVEVKIVGVHVMLHDVLVDPAD